MHHSQTTVTSSLRDLLGWDMSRQKLPPHVRKVKNRTGREYYLFQRHRGTPNASKSHRLPDDPNSGAFWGAYAELMQLPIVQNPTSINSLIGAWQASPEWVSMASRTQYEWTRYSKQIAVAWGQLDVAAIEPKHVLALRDSMADRPGAANMMLDTLNAMIAWSVPRGWRRDNPCREIKRFPKGEGYHPWPWEVIERAQAELRPDLWQAVALALYTGQRMADVLAMRWDALTDGFIYVKQGKTGKRLEIPVHARLWPVLEAAPRSAVTILTNTKGRPWTTSSFKPSWNRARPAFLREYQFHGLRKTAVTSLLEAGCEIAQVAAVTGQSYVMVEHYAKRINQPKMARQAMDKWEH